MSNLDLFTAAKSESHRQKKVAEEIRFQLAQILSRGDLPTVRNPKTNKFLSYTNPITITRIEISADLRHATAYITSLGGIEQDKALQFIRLQRGYLRKTLSGKMQLRFTPDLHFKLDDSFENANLMLQKISKVISEDERRANVSQLDDENHNDQPESVHEATQ